MTSKVLVVGSGVIGLRTALELLRRKIRVSLVSPRHPLHPSTCSMGAGGLWMPFHCDDARTDSWSFQTLSELSSVTSTNASDSTVRPLVEILPAVSFQRNCQTQIPGWATDSKAKSLAFQHLSIEELFEESKSQGFRLPNKELLVGSGYTHAWFFQAPIIDAPTMLMRMLKEIQSSKYADHVDVETDRYFTTIEEMAEEARALGCDGLVNCTGLGSKVLCDDPSLVGARGVLLHYNRASCIWRDEQETDLTEDVGHSSNVVKDSVILIEEPPFGSETMPSYMIPRGDIIAIGGTYLEGDTKGSIRQSERERVLENAWKMGIDTDKTKPVGEWVGFRPYRPTSRLEVDVDATTKSGVKVVHSYGYGGSGWTVFVGAAKEAVSLLS